MPRLVVLMMVLGILSAAPIAVAADADISTDVVTIPKMHDRHLRNPGMGLILYGIPNPLFQELPDEADILYITIAWHDVEQKEGQYRWEDKEPIALLQGKDAALAEGFHLKLLTRAMALAKEKDRKVAIRLVTSWQNYRNPIPDYLADEGVKLFPYGNVKKWGFNTFFEPEWWNPKYCAAYANLIKAYGAQFDGNTLIAWIDMRYYGFWNEGHRYQNTQPWPADVDKREYCRQWIDLHFDVFKKTPLVVETAGDKDVPYPHGTAIDYAVKKGAWMRRDGFGAFINAKETAFLDANWEKSLVIAENGRSFRDHLDNKVFQGADKSKPVTLEALFDEMFDRHANYVPLGWGMAEYKLLKDKPELLKKVSLKVGYRFVVSESRWPRTIKAGTEIEIKTKWRNDGVGHLPFQYQPRIYLLDKSGHVLSEAGEYISEKGERADLTTWIAGTEYSAAFRVKVPPASPETCSVAVGVVDDKQVPVVSLGIEGDDGSKRFVLGDIQVAHN